MQDIITGMPNFMDMDKASFENYTEKLIEIDKRRTCRTGKRSLGELKIERKSKKIFTYCRPAQLDEKCHEFNEGAEVYEATGSFRLIHIEKTDKLTKHKQVEQLKIVPLPRVTVETSQIQIDPKILHEGHSKQSQTDATQLQMQLKQFQRTKTLPESYKYIHKPIFTPVGTTEQNCFPDSAYQSDLYYTISNQSLPQTELSTTIQTKPSNEPNRTITGNPFLKAPIPVNHLCTTTTNDKQHHKLNCPNWNNMLTEELTETLLSLIQKTPRFLSFAKFNSSFRLTEEFYEDINRSLSRISKMSEALMKLSLQKFACIHRVNPDFDENQSLTEAMLYPTSSFASSRTQSELISKLYGRECNFDNLSRGLLSECKDDFQVKAKSSRSYESKKDKPCINLSRIMSAVRKQRFSAVEISLLKQNLLKTSSEHSIQESSNFTHLGRYARPLCKIRVNWTELFNEQRSKIYFDFVSKAHHYMCDKNYRNLSSGNDHSRQQLDQSTQFPDYPSDEKNMARQIELRSEKYEVGEIQQYYHLDVFDSGEKYLHHTTLNNISNFGHNQETLRSRKNSEKEEQFFHSFRALCDKRRIRIKYEHGRYTIYKAKRRQKKTFWSLLTGKALNLIHSVMTKSPNIN